MSRSCTTLDRIAALIVGLLFLAVGAALLIWNTNWLNGIPEAITAPGLVTVAGSAWWPWIVTLTGIALVLLGFRWLASHRLPVKARAVQLRGGGGSGVLSADLSAIAEAATRRLQADPSVRSAKAKAVVDRGHVTLDVTTTAASVADLPAAVAVADQVCCDAVTMLGDDTVATRTKVRVDTKGRHGRQLD